MEGKTKLAYTVIHGLGPYFHMLFREIKDCNFIKVLFEEAFYDAVQESQLNFFMGLYIKYVRGWTGGFTKFFKKIS